MLSALTIDTEDVMLTLIFLTACSSSKGEDTAEINDPQTPAIPATRVIPAIQPTQEILLHLILTDFTADGLLWVVRFKSVCRCASCGLA